jgi:hypothetical protein
MAKPKLKTFCVQKRYEVWVQTEVKAETFDLAVQEGKNLKVGDFIEVHPGVEFNDSNELPGFGVQENW